MKIVIRKSILLALMAFIGLGGCSRFDWTKFPLYDEVFVKQETGLENPARKRPIENP